MIIFVVWEDFSNISIQLGLETRQGWRAIKRPHVIVLVMDSKG